MAVVLIVLGCPVPSTAQSDGGARIEVEIEKANLSLDELRRLVPALGGVALPADVRVERLTASGPLTSMTLDFAIGAGTSHIAGMLTGDFTWPTRTFAGSVTVDGVNLAQLLDRPALPTRITGRMTVDLALDTSGAVPSITGTYSVNAARVAVAGYVAQDVEAGGRFDGQTVIVNRARADAYSGSFTAEGRVGLPLGNQSLSVRLSGRAERVNLQRLPDSVPGPSIDTRLSLDYRLNKDGQGWTGRATFERSRVAEGTVSAGTVATFDATGERIAYTAQGEVMGIDPQRMGQALDIEMLSSDRFAGTVTGSFSLAGTGATLRPVSFSLIDSRLFGGSIPQLEGTLSLSEDRVEFSATGSFAGLEASRILQDGPVDATVTGSLGVRGGLRRDPGEFEWRDLGISGTVNLADGRIEGVPITTLSLSGSLDDLVMRVQELDLQSPTLTASASGTLAFDGSTSSMLKYDVDVPSLSALRDVLGEIRGDIDLTGTITGSDVLQIDGRMSSSDLAYHGAIATDVDGSYRVALQPQAPLSATGDVHVEAAVVEVGGRMLTGTSIDARYADRRVGFDATVHEEERSISARGSLLMHPGRQEVLLSAFRFESPAAVWQLSQGRRARIDYNGQRVVVEDFHLETPNGQAVTAEGTLGTTTDDGPLEIWIEGLALADLDALVFREQKITGRLDAYAAVTGPLSAATVDTRFTVANGSVRNFQYQSLRGSLQTIADRYAFSVWLLQTPTAWLTAEGSLPRSVFGAGDVPSSAQMDVRLRSGPIGLGFIGGVTDAVTDVEGTIQADVHMTGTPKQPVFDGHLTIASGAFRAPVLGTRFRGLDTEIRFERDAMVIPEFRLLDENNQWLRFAGRLPYAAGRIGDVTIDVDSENFEIIDNDLADIQVSTDLEITGTLVEPKLQGSVRITDGEVRIDRILNLRQASYYRVAPLESDVDTATAQADASNDSILSNTPIALDIDLDVPALVIVGRDLRGPQSVPVGLGDVNLTLEGQVRLDKTVNSPLLITGDIGTVRGTYEFQGRRFDILRDGSVRFPGLIEINPLLDITAKRTISGVDTQIRIEGTLRTPELTLISQPPLDQADILSLIVFNQPANELGASQQVSLGRRAVALASGFVASQLSQSIGSLLNVDLLEIEAGGQGTEGLGPSVTLGEQIGEKLFVRVRQQFGPASTSQFVVEYEFADWLRLESTVSDQSRQTQSLFRRGERSGVNWIFTFSY
jgi:autotransporter translocation and assembly factor TamB